MGDKGVGEQCVFTIDILDSRMPVDAVGFRCSWGEVILDL